MKYIVKKDCWFKEGTEAKILEEIGDGMSLYEGIYIVDDTDYDQFWITKGYQSGDEVIMREVCNDDEFEILL